MKKLGMYIHIPFCKSKCLYCDFTTMPYQDKRIEEYFDLLAKEIYLYKEEYKNYIIDTIYIGGGTPSYVDSKYIVEINELIKEYFNIAKEIEYTIEINPGTINTKKLEDYNEIGINRVSMGIQSFNDKLLKLLGRNHNSTTSILDFDLLRKFEFNNISIDLMMGLPNQTKKDIIVDLDNISKLNPEHISWYNLIIEENTRFHKLYRENKLVLPNEEDDRMFYSFIIEELRNQKINQYEISNFSKFGNESKHNLKYWNVQECIGLGIGAAGYLKGYRYSNVNKYNEYKKILLNNKKPLLNIEKINNKDKIFEKIIMNMRLTSGVDINDLKENYNYDIMKSNKDIIENYKELNLIEIKNNKLYFTKNGFNISNKFFVDINI